MCIWLVKRNKRPYCLGTVRRVKFSTRCSASHADAVSCRVSSWPTVANAHVVLARSFGLKSLKRRSASFANAVNNDASGWLNDANAHAVMMKFCRVKFPALLCLCQCREQRCIWPADHRECLCNVGKVLRGEVPMRDSAFLAHAMHHCASGWPTVAMPMPCWRGYASEVAQRCSAPLSTLPRRGSRTNAQTLQMPTLCWRERASILKDRVAPISTLMLFHRHCKGCINSRHAHALFRCLASAVNSTCPPDLLSPTPRPCW